MNTLTVDHFTVRLVRQGQFYGRGFALCNEGPDALVEFYDLRHQHTKFGQFVSRYYFATIAQHVGALCLDSGVPEWSVSAEGMAAVKAWLKTFKE